MSETLYAMDLPHTPELDALVEKLAETCHGEPSELVARALCVLLLQRIYGACSPGMAAHISAARLMDVVCLVFDVDPPTSPDGLARVWVQ